MSTGLIIEVLSFLLTFSLLVYAGIRRHLLLIGISIAFIIYLFIEATGPFIFGFSTNYNVFSENIKDARKKNVVQATYNAAYIANVTDAKIIALPELNCWVEVQKVYYPYYYFFTGSLKIDSTYIILKFDGLPDALNKVIDFNDNQPNQWYEFDYEENRSPINNNFFIGTDSIKDTFTIEVLQRRFDNEKQIGYRIKIGKLILKKSIQSKS